AEAGRAGRQGPSAGADHPQEVQDDRGVLQRAARPEERVRGARAERAEGRPRRVRARVGRRVHVPGGGDPPRDLPGRRRPRPDALQRPPRRGLPEPRPAEGGAEEVRAAGRASPVPVLQALTPGGAARRAVRTGPGCTRAGAGDRRPLSFQDRSGTRRPHGPPAAGGVRRRKSGTPAAGLRTVRIPGASVGGDGRPPRRAWWSANRGAPTPAVCYRRGVALKTRSPRAFTLIELLVVIAIIALLIGIL